MIVTDSSAYLPPDLVATHPIRVIPLTLNWDGQTYRDGVDIQATEFYNRLSTSSTLPSTSQIPPGDFENIIKELLVVDYDVLLLPISSGISGSYQSAASVVNNFPADRVVLLDTKLVSMALGFQVLAAARAAAAGANLTECKQTAQQAYGHIGVFFTVDTLKYLAAGGRINSAKRLLGAALDIKPILEIRDGKIELVNSVRTRNKAIDRMLQMVEKEIGGRSPVRISVFHALAPETAEELLETARLRFSPIEYFLSEISPVVGSHVGPSTVAIAYHAGG
ncbi:DegV family protein [Anaerolinea sp.]|uniref:DegV family protein n=1 Tax=Anaerolinea sp. TaxID=1872519 RepID=UPI002ACE7A57|nr:DegV family protein [Anaerolinea sp.]